MRLGCIYKYNPPVRFSRRIIIFVLDFLLLFFLTLIGFSICDNIVTKTEGTKSYRITEQSAQAHTELLKLIEESKLGYLAGQNICGTDVMAKSFVHSLCTVEATEYIEPLFYYYGTFKQEQKEKFLNLDHLGKEYAWNRLKNELGENGTDWLEPCSPEENLTLQEPVSQALKSWLVDSQESIEIDGKIYNGKSICEELELAYQMVLSEARDDFVKGYLPYETQYRIFEVYRNQLLLQKWLLIILVFFAITVLLYIIIPIFFGGASLTNKLFHMLPCTRNGEMVSIWSVLLKWLAETVTYFNVIHVVFVILYSGNSGMMFMQEIAGSLKFSHLYFMSVGVMILSAACCAFGKKNCCTLSDLVSWQLMKDIRD